MDQGFNPSFTGIALVAEQDCYGFDDKLTFQSFFYWNCLGGQRLGTSQRLGNPVSILLLLELPWWRTGGGSSSAAISSFNPSFTGIALVAA